MSISSCRKQDNENTDAQVGDAGGLFKSLDPAPFGAVPAYFIQSPVWAVPAYLIQCSSSSLQFQSTSSSAPVPAYLIQCSLPHPVLQFQPIYLIKCSSSSLYLIQHSSSSLPHPCSSSSLPHPVLTSSMLLVSSSSPHHNSSLPHPGAPIPAYLIQCSNSTVYLIQCSSFSLPHSVLQFHVLQCRRLKTK